MSDFLSNFDKNNYEKTLNDKQGKKVESEKKIPVEAELPLPSRSQKEAVEEVSRLEEELALDEMGQSEINEDNQSRETDAEFVSQPIDQSLPEEGGELPQAVESRVQSRTKANEEETEIDPTYKNRQRNKLIIFSVIGVVAAILLYWLYYSFTHVEMPDFTSKQISEARTWASEENVALKVEQEYNFDKEVNTVIKQDAKAGKKVKKKSTVTVVASLGANPEDVIPLPDFAKMSKTAADDWVTEHKAENLSILEEYSDKIEKSKFIRQEINNKEVKPETYKREDQAVVYFSKGKEVFEKDVAVPDFKNKPKSDVEAWVKTNEIKMEYKEVDSDTVAEGLVLTQSIEKGKKVAKRDGMSVEISTGKAVVVPYFGDFTPESAGTAVEGLQVIVKNTFSSEVPYGSLISQSIESGTKLKEKELKPVTVIYSAGRPYLRSYYGVLEGDLEKTFFDDYRSKGANITYTTYYVDSSEERGKVVDMSAYNEFVPLDYVVSIAISNGSLAGKPNETPTAPDNGGSGNSNAGNGTPSEDDGGFPEGDEF